MMSISEIILVIMLIVCICIMAIFGVIMYITFNQKINAQRIECRRYADAQTERSSRRSTMSNTADVRTSTPIQITNIPTRGSPEPYRQVGVLTSNDHERKVVPLYGRRTMNRSSKWNYYTSTDGYHRVDIPVMNKNKDCNDEYGCEELQSGDTVTLPVYNTSYNVMMYKQKSFIYVA